MTALALKLREKLNLEDFLFQAKSIMIQNTDSGVQLPGSKSRLCLFPGVWPWKSDLTSLDLSPSVNLPH